MITLTVRLTFKEQFINFGGVALQVCRSTTTGKKRSEQLETT